MRRSLALAVAVVFALAACTGGTDAPPREGAASSPAIVGAAAAPVVSPTPDRQPPTAFAAVPTTRYLPMWKTPTGSEPSFAFDTQNSFGGLSPLLVVGKRRDAAGERWFRLQLPIRPNGSAAWVPENEIRLVPRDQELVIDISQRTLSRYVAGKLVDRFRVGVGQPQYPTAIGTFFVWIKVPQPSPYGPYGVFALGLSGFSPVLSDWPGGGRMAIHGTSNPSDRGQQVSHGCIRVYNPDMQTLRAIPLGTPVVIRR